MIAAKNTADDQAKAQGVKRVREMLEGFLPDNERDEDDGGSAPFGKETSVIVNQLACMEAGCPDVEVVCTLLRAKPRPKLMFKIYKAAKDLSSEEVEAAMKKAIAEEAGEHEHGHAEPVAAKGSGCHDDCCEHEHGHGHDHRDSSENSDAPPHDHHDVTGGGRLPLSSAMVLLLALSFHSFLEGLGMGSAESHDQTLSLLLLIALHKGLAAFALGMSFFGAGLGRRATVVLGGTFALATPIGVAFGVLLRSSAENSTPSAVCVAAAAGSFVYVALVEVLPRELAHRAARRRTQLAALLTGFAIFAALAVWL